MAARQPKGLWKKLKTGGRWLRVTVLLVLLVSVSALLYLNFIGLPGFIKRPLVAELRKQGIELQFSRLRLSFYRGIVADDVRVGQTEHPLKPRLTATQARLRISYGALFGRRLEVKALGLYGGQLLVPVAGTNSSPQKISLQDINAEVEFLPDDEWRLQTFEGEFLGGKLSASGRIKHASAIRDWPFLQKTEPAEPGTLQNRLRDFADVLDQIEFLETPQLHLQVEGDARNLQTFTARLVVTAPATETSWGTLKGGILTLRIFPQEANAPPYSSLLLEALEAHTPWAITTNFQLSANFTALPGQTNVDEVIVSVHAAQAWTRWARATNLNVSLHLMHVPGELNLVDGTVSVLADSAQTKWAHGFGIKADAHWRHSLTNPVPISGDARVHLEDARTEWASATNLTLIAQLAETVSNTRSGDPSWGWWTNIEPYRLAWDLRLENAAVRDVLADKLISAGTWDAPHLVVTNLQAQIHKKLFRAEGQLDVNTRRTSLRISSGINPHHVESLLTTGARKWLSQFNWNSAPQVEGTVSVVLPPWTASEPDWRDEVRPSLNLDGTFQLEGGGTYRKVPVSTAHSRITYTNETWYLPNLFVTRPEGHLSAVHRASDRTKEFSWKISSTLQPAIVRPLLGTNEQRGLDLLVLSDPPHLEAEVEGVFHHPDTLRLRGKAALTNFSFRAQSFSALQTEFDYTNKWLRFSMPAAQRDNQLLKADQVIVDFHRELVYITNGFSTAEPLPVARAIGKKVSQAIEAYQFALPPVVRVWGAVPLRGEEGADLRFSVDGGPFHWHRFNVPRIQGDVHWAGMRLLLTNVKIDFYGGKADGTAQFYFGEGKGTDYEFALSATNAILQDLMADYFNRTNSLEGRLNGTVVITRANTEDWRQVQGFGALDLRDGLIWDIPLFGVLSPALNSVMPGLGSSRASSATCSFTIRNGVVHTDDLEARAPAMRLKYRGSVDLEGNVDARVEAELLRDIWVLGPIVSTVFWPVTKMFEYRATGTLGDPNLDPVYIFPKLVKIPFQPLRIFRGLFPTENGSGPPKEQPSDGPAPPGASR